MKVDVINTIPTSVSTDSEWIVWHKAMKARFGKKQANMAFLKAWNRRNKDGFITSGKANTVTLREYVEKQGFKIDNGGALSYLADMVDETMDFFSSTFGVAKISMMAIGIIIFLVLVYAVIRIVRNPNQYAELIKSLTIAKVAA